VHDNDNSTGLFRAAVATQLRTLGGADFSGARRGAVSASDIQTVHQGDLSELQANSHRRPVTAHNITLQRIVDDAALYSVQVARYEFRLPFLPQRDPSASENAQTIEGMLVTWDGSGQRLDLGVGFQWYLNPWGGGAFGELRVWSTAEDPRGEWVKVDMLHPDTKWHSVTMEVDDLARTTALLIDDRAVMSYFTATTKPADWGPETAARLTAEIISCDPGDVGYSALHRAQFRRWSWIWR
jgi:hypothetical protein